MSSTMDKSNLVNLMLSDYTPVSASEKTDRGGFVSFGVDNLFPQYLRSLAETSPIHGSLCISIGDMIAGKGLDAGVYQSRVDALDTYEVYYGCAHDLKKYGGFFIEVIYSVDRLSIAKINHIPFEECRMAIEGEDEAIIGVYQSDDWSAPKKKKNKPTFIPKYNPLTATKEPRQIYWSFYYTSGQTYPRPDYWSAVNYIELSKKIGIYHVNNISSGLFPSFIVSFFGGAPDPDQQRAMMRDWENKLSGERNAGKFIMTFNERDTPKPDITAFPISDADKQYQFLSEASRTEVLTGHRVTTPLIFGIRAESGFGSNSDEMKIGLQIFNTQVIEPAQRKLAKAFTEVLSYEMEGLQINVIPNTPIEMTPQVVAPTATPVTQAMDAHSYQPTDEMANEAEIGLKWRAEYGRGGTEVGVARARDISNKRNLSIDTIERMNSYFSRHEVDKEASGWNQGEEGFPSAGRIAWQLWGGDAGRDWAERIIARIERESLHSLSKVRDVEMSDDDEKYWIDAMTQRGEYIDLNEWQLVSEEDACHTHDEEVEAINKIQSLELASYDSYANGDRKSQWGDSGLYKLRYAYTTNISKKSRDFCRVMVSMSKEGKVFRYEDIQQMSDNGVNGQFAPSGQSSYDIFTFKGGCYCRHAFKRLIFMRKRDEKGRILPNKGLENDKRVGNNPYVPQKGIEGQTPYSMPNHASLKYTYE